MERLKDLRDWFTEPKKSGYLPLNFFLASVHTTFQHPCVERPEATAQGWASELCCVFLESGLQWVLALGYLSLEYVHPFMTNLVGVADIRAAVTCISHAVAIPVLLIMIWNPLTVVQDIFYSCKNGMLPGSGKHYGYFWDTWLPTYAEVMVNNFCLVYFQEAWLLLVAI